MLLISGDASLKPVLHMPLTYRSFGHTAEHVLSLCNSRKYPYPPQGRLMEIPTKEGVSKTNSFQGKYEAKPEFPVG